MSKNHISFGIKNGLDEQLTLDTLVIKKAGLVLRAFNHKLRQQILRFIDAREKVAVTEIYVKLRVEQSVASSHLAILRKANLVKTERDGRWIYYTINYQRIERLKMVGELLS